MKKTFLLEERLLHIFGDKSLAKFVILPFVYHGASLVSFVMLKSLRANGDELQSGVNMLVRAYIAKRKIKVGDRHYRTSRSASLVSFL